jgi:general secretion pathway protein K
MRTSGERGYALLVVLWSLVLISLLTAQVLASGRGAVALANNLRAGAEARARADGAINQAIFHLLADGTAHWAPDGSVHVLARGDEPISVRIRLLDDKINPNLASIALLAGLFQSCGAAKAQAYQLANAVIQWRSQAVSQSAEAAALASYKRANLPYGPPGRPFGTLDDLANVMGMPPGLLAAALPHMSLYQLSDPDAKSADAVVRQALRLSGQPGSSSRVYDGTPPIVAIEASVAGPGKSVLRRDAIVSIATGGRPYQFLALGDGE